jgi:chromosome segregation ATPase
MNGTPYDKKNVESFDAVTFNLTEALKRIEKDLSLPVNVTTLAKLADVHRNTIYHRGWPKNELTRIKAAREQAKKDQAVAKADTKSLELSRLEIMYWFTQLEDARTSNKSLTATNKLTASSRDHYMSEVTKNRELISKLRTDISKLESTITVLEDEIAKLQSRD